MYPKSDGLKLGITIEMPPSTTLDKSQEIAGQAGEILRGKSYLESVVMLVGQKSPLAVQGLGDALGPTVAQNFVGFSCVFVPREDREKPAYEVVDELRDEILDLLNNRYAAARPGSPVGWANGFIVCPRGILLADKKVRFAR